MSRKTPNNDQAGDILDVLWVIRRRRKVYFYVEGDNWIMSVSLPQEIHFRLGSYVTIELDTDRPYTHFEKHKRRYPPGQLKKKNKKWVKY